MIDLNYYSLSLFLGGLVALASGIAVFFSKEKESTKIRLPWMLLNISSAIWSFGYFEMITAVAHLQAYGWDVILHFGAVMIPLFYLTFVLALTGTYDKHKIFLWLSMACGGVFILMLPFPIFVQDVFPKYIFGFAPNAGPAYKYFAAYFFIITTFSAYILLRQAIASSRPKSLRLLYVFLSSLAGFIGGGSVFFLTFNIPIPPFPI